MDNRENQYTPGEENRPMTPPPQENESQQTQAQSQGYTGSSESPAPETPRQETYYSSNGYSQSYRPYGSPDAGQQQPRQNGYVLGNPGGGQWSSGHAYQNQPGFGEAPGYYPPQPQKKQKKGASKGFVAVAVVLCILLSGAVGYGGSLYAIKNAKVSGTTVTGALGTVNINYVTAEKPVDENALTEMGDAAYVASVAADSVVEISTESVSTGSIFSQYVTQGAGSGVIIDENGIIITCAHVIEGAETITVKLTDGTTYDAVEAISDSETDIGIIKINATGLKAATVGSSEGLVVGQRVFAIGNPMGTLGGTVTDGIVSALNRSITIDNQNYNLLQTNAAINPGNSGGGLFDAEGHLIGIVNAKSVDTELEGLGFAIPSDHALEIASQLITSGYVRNRPAFGITILNIPNRNAYWNILNSGEYRNIQNYLTEYGVYFTGYTENAVNTENGMQYGDRIVSVDGTEITSATDLSQVIRSYNVGDVVKVIVSRVNDTGRLGTQEIEIEVTIVEALREN